MCVLILLLYVLILLLYVLIILLCVCSLNILVRKPVASSHTTIYVSSYYHIYVSSYNIYIYKDHQRNRQGVRAGREAVARPGMHASRQHLYLSTSKASKLSTEGRARGSGSSWHACIASAFVLFYQ
jgi:hypothetical protein